MKRLVFAVALGASVAAFGAFSSFDNAISFEGYTAQTSVQIENGVEYDETGEEKSTFYFYYDGSSADGSEVKAFGGGNAAAPQISRPARFASASPNDKYLELDTADGVLWRSLDEASITESGSPMGIAEGGTYFDSLMQFKPVPYGVTNEVSEAEKLAIWLQVDKVGETTVTNLIARAAYIDNDGSTTSAIATNYVLATSAPIVPDQWYRLTVKAISGVTRNPNDGEKITGFEIFLDGAQLSASTSTFGAGYIGYATGGWLDATTNADFIIYLQSGKVLPSLLGQSDDTTLQAVGFRGAGAVDDLVWDENDPLATVAIGDVSYRTLSEALENAETGDTLTLLQNVELTAGITFASANASFLTLDLGGHTLSYPTASSSEYMITVNPTNLLVITNGTITTTGCGAWVYGYLELAAGTSLTADCRALNIVGVDNNTNMPAVCIIDAGATVTHGNGDTVAIFVRGSASDTRTFCDALAFLDVYGTVVDTATTPGQYGITGNGGNATFAEINFYEGSVYTFADTTRPMMWLPQNDLNLYGGTLTSAGGGIFVLCGRVNVPADSTVTVTANGPAGTYVSYSGGDYTGDALYFAAEGARYPRSQYKDALPEGVGVNQVEANIAGGTFTSANGAAIAAYVDPLRNDATALTNFVSGGLYSSEPAAALLAPKCVTKTVSDPAGYYTVCRWLLGSGTAQDPFQIADRADLEFFRDQVNNANALGTAGQHFVQLADIDLGGDRWIDIGNVNASAACFVSSPVFSGVYDGGGHVVSNFVLSGYSYCGFFGTIANGTVKNLQILDARSPDTYVAGTQPLQLASGAAFCGDIEGGFFENVTVSGTVWGNHNIGGFSSWCEGNVTMLSCTNLANVGTTFTKLGGFHSYYGNTMTLFCSNCCNKGTLTFDKVQRGTSSDATAAVGGFVGYQQNPGKMVFVDCVNEGVLNATYTSGSVGVATLGGFVGRANTSGISLAITNGVSSGAIAANVTNANEQAEVGGFIGRMVSGVSLSMDNVKVAAGTAMSATVQESVTPYVRAFVGRDLNSTQTAILTYGIAPSAYEPGIAADIAGGYNSTSTADGLTTYFIESTTEFADDGAEGLLTTNTTVTAVDVATYVAGVTGAAAPTLVTKPMVLSYLLNANKILTTPETDVLKITEIKQVAGGWAITVAADLNAADVAAGATVDMYAITGDLEVVATADLGTDFAPVAAANFEVVDGTVDGTAVIMVTDSNAKFLKATVTK